MVEEGKRFISAVGHAEGVIRKEADRHRWHRLGGAEGEGHGNYKTLFG